MKRSRMVNLATFLIASVWIFHGIYSKMLDQLPRHRLIVGRILGEEFAPEATVIIGVGEVMLGLWVLTRRARRWCAVTQTVGLVAMNSLEILFARDLLISAPGMIVLNLAFLAIVWWWATR